MTTATLLLLAAIPAALALDDGTQNARNVILEEEIRNARGSTLYDIVRVLRPQWLRRNPTTLRRDAEGDIVVYLERARLGGPTALRQIQPTTVILIRFYTPSEAQGEFGTGHLHGAIQVKTRTQ